MSFREIFTDNEVRVLEALCRLLAGGTVASLSDLKNVSLERMPAHDKNNAVTSLKSKGTISTYKTSGRKGRRPEFKRLNDKTVYKLIADERAKDEIHDV